MNNKNITLDTVAVATIFYAARKHREVEAACKLYAMRKEERHTRFSTRTITASLGTVVDSVYTATVITDKRALSHTTTPIKQPQLPTETVDISKEAEEKYYRKEQINTEDNTVTIRGRTFQRHKNAYLGDKFTEGYNNIYVEKYNLDYLPTEVLELIGQLRKAKHNVIITDKPIKAAQFNKPKGYILVAYQLDNDIIKRVQELLKYKCSVRVVTVLGTNYKFKSRFSIKSCLDYVCYKFTNDRTKKSPFIAELANEKGSKFLQFCRDKHVEFVQNWVYNECKFLYTEKKEETRERTYKSLLKGIYYPTDRTYTSKHVSGAKPVSKAYQLSAAGVNKYLNSDIGIKATAKAVLLAKYYGFSVNLEPSVATSDSFKTAKEIFPDKPNRARRMHRYETEFIDGKKVEHYYWEEEDQGTSVTIYDRGEQALASSLATARLKGKVYEQQITTKDELYDIISFMDLAEKSGINLYDDPEDTTECICGSPISVRDYRCIICDTKNRHYLDEFTTDDNAMLNQRIEEMRNEEVTTYYLEGQKHF